PDPVVGGRGALVVPPEAALAQARLEPRRGRADHRRELLRGLQGAGEVAREHDRLRAQALRGGVAGRRARLLPAARGEAHLGERARAGDGDDQPLDVGGGFAVAEHPEVVHGGSSQGVVTLPGFRLRPGSLSANRPLSMRTPTSPMSWVIHGWCSVPTAWWCETVEPRSTKVCCTAFF